MAAILPGVLLAAWYAALAVGGAFGHEWLWPPLSQTLSEAVALGDVGEVVRQIELGADPNRPALVSRGFLKRDPVVLTPLEAAVERQRTDLIQLLIGYGARADEATLNPLRCAASRLGDTRTRAVLDRLSTAPVDCTRVTLPPL